MTTFEELCRRADAEQAKKPKDPHVLELRRLLESTVSWEALWSQLNTPHERAAASTIEALMLSLRTRGTAALEEPATKRRLGELSEQQIIEVGNRVQRLKPTIARPWSAEEVQVLFRARVGK
jgi:hypothetical protein